MLTGPWRYWWAISWTAPAIQTTPTVLAFRSYTNLLTRIGRRALIPSSSPTPVLDLTPTITPTLPRSRSRMCGLGRVDRVLSRILRYAGAGSRRGRAYFNWNPATTLVSSIEVQLTALQGREMSQFAIDSSAVLGCVRNHQMYFYRQRNPVSLTVPTAIASPWVGAYVQFRGPPTTGQTLASSASQAQPQQSQSVNGTNPLSLTLRTSSTRLTFTTTQPWCVVESRISEVHRAATQAIHGLDSERRSVPFADASRLPQRPVPQRRQG
eukprot:1258265-Pleurochrysis_carterae.AAC.1